MSNDDAINRFMDGDPAANVNDEVINEIFNAKSTLHADDAVDYEDIDELAEDDEILQSSISRHGSPVTDNESKLQQQADEEFDNIFYDDDNDSNNRLLGGHLQQFNDLDDMNMDELYGEEDFHARGKRKLTEEQRQHKRQKLLGQLRILEVRQKKRNLKYHYPDFNPKKPFNNHKLFLPDPKYYKFQVPWIAFKPKSFIPNRLSLEVDVDQKRIFKTGKQPLNYSLYKRNVTSITDQDLKLLELIKQNGGLNVKRMELLPYLMKDGSNDDKFRMFDKNLVLASADWNDESIINAEPINSIKLSSFDELDEQDSGLDDEDDENIFNGTINTEKINLNMNDPNLLFENIEIPTIKTNSIISVNEKLLSSKFNVSNDDQYEIFKSNYNVKVRSQISNLNIEHSVPALRLQSPFYKVKLTKEEARCFHRPKFNPKVGLTINFSKVRTRKHKKDKGKTAKEIFSKTNDLTVGDNSTFIGMEYCEEFPMILSGYGMGSKLINYYRRTRPDDNSRPKDVVGETIVLGVEDRSPFWNYGHVDKGDLVPTLYNNMIRAPIFKQEVKSTDFLLVKSQGGVSKSSSNGIYSSFNNHPRYFLKKLDHLFGVGHIFPSVEIPAPQSRKVTNISKNRLKMIVYRTMNKNGKPRISVKDISHHFPDQNDMQNRQRLKEFMEYQRSGEDQGFWRIKVNENIPDEDAIRAMITPEDVSLLDSMQASQQLLNDLLIFLNEDQQKEKSKKDKSQEVNLEKESEDQQKEKKKKDKLIETEEGLDEQLTSWNLSRNFVSSNQTRSMLQLNGEGDPTGIGIGFSLLKTSQKSAFQPFFPPPKANVPKSNQAAYQQKLYDQEVSRIWYTQKKSLTGNLNQIYSKYKPINHAGYLRKKYEESNTDFTKHNKILRINRRIRDQNGVLQRKVEIIKDPRIIQAYLKRKKELEDNLIKSANLEDIVPTDDADMNEIRRKALEKRLANAEKQMKQYKPKRVASDLHLKSSSLSKADSDLKNTNLNNIKLPEGSLPVGNRGVGKGNSTRTCATCGAVGHIKTNKSCPLYKQA